MLNNNKNLSNNDLNDPLYFDFLNNLRESGVTNMFGASPYLQEVFPELSKNEAKSVLINWMKSY